MRPINDRWRGVLTTKNIGEVAAVFYLMFGRRRFTYTRVHPNIVPSTSPLVVETKVDIFPGLKLEARRNGVKVAPVYVTRDSDPERAMLTVGTTGWLCMYDTRLTDAVGKFDYTYKNPYITFDGNRCEIKYQTPCGDQVVDVFHFEYR